MHKNLALFLLIIGIFGCSATKPSNLGLRKGKLTDCPPSPNCVSSQSPDPQHFVEPIAFEGPELEAKKRLMKVLQGMKRVAIKTDQDHYVHAEFTSLIFRFVDDAEFLIDPEARVIHVRSASRTGTSDLGVNRRRVEEIRKAFNRDDG